MPLSRLIIAADVYYYAIDIKMLPPRCHERQHDASRHYFPHCRHIAAAQRDIRELPRHCARASELTFPLLAATCDSWRALIEMLEHTHATPYAMRYRRY